MPLLRDAARSVLDFCFPRECPGCGGRHATGDSSFCPTCDALLDQLTATPHCPRCGAPLHLAGAPCGHCNDRGLRPFSRVATLATYREPLRLAIHQLKYRRRWPLAAELADRLLARLAIAGGLPEWLTGADVLVPVPLHVSRQVDRGFNQADVVARHLGRRLDVPVARPARRVRATDSQATLSSRAKRHLNLRDAFALTDPAAIRGRHVVVVDDVLTTGATLRSLAKALRPAGPASLTAVTLCVADGKGRDFAAV